MTSEAELRLRGIQVYETERGGDVIYHGPGQLTVYPIINLDYFKKDIHLFLRFLEEVVISLLADFGIDGMRNFGLTGVWVKNKKIASIGISVRHWITFHGLSININEYDLLNFGLIKPCGMDIKMTSLETLLREDIRMQDIKERVIRKIGRYLGLAPKTSLSLAARR